MRWMSVRRCFFFEDEREKLFIGGVYDVSEKDRYEKGTKECSGTHVPIPSVFGSENRVYKS